MSDDPKLDKLKRQIEKAQEEAEPIRLTENKSFNKVGEFFNVGVELVSGVFVGLGCGLLIDWLFGTSPWGLISLFILGSIAGMLNVYRVLTKKDKADIKKDIDV
jgi:ATP synthase protein I